MNGSLAAVDLYSGCGGLTQGLKAAGFAVVAAVEIDPVACETYRSNHSEVTLFQGDISDITPKEVCKRAGVSPSDLTLVAACAPCQYFSKQNRLPSKDNSLLVDRFVDFVEALRPPVIFTENVTGLASGRGEAVYRNAVGRLEGLGYALFCGLLDAADYGVPQHRRRLILLGSRLKGLVPKRPRARFTDPGNAASRKRGRWRTVRDAIGHLPPVRAGEQSDYHPLHWASRLSAVNLERLAFIPADGGDRLSLPARLRLRCHESVSGYTDVYGRLWWDKPAPTLTTGFLSITKGRFGHPDQLRGLSLLEGALLQSFDESYRFAGSRVAVARQIGNAVPPLFAAAVLRDIVEELTAARGFAAAASD